MIINVLQLFNDVSATKRGKIHPFYKYYSIPGGIGLCNILFIPNHIYFIANLLINHPFYIYYSCM